MGFHGVINFRFIGQLLDFRPRRWLARALKRHLVSILDLVIVLRDVRESRVP